MTPTLVDAHWLDFYALLGVPLGASEEIIRKRIGKVYSEAAANSDHRDLTRRHYFQAMIERVLPQCRRVLLDAKWRLEYDRQHVLNAQGDPKAQTYIDFIAAMRGHGSNHGSNASGDEEVLPQRMQEDINLAREVVECAWQGAQLDLLPSQSVSNRGQSAEISAAAASPIVAPGDVAPPMRVAAAPQKPAKVSPQPVKVVAPIAVAPVLQESLPPKSAVQTAPVAATGLTPAPPLPTPIIEEVVQRGDALHAQILTAEEAALLRRERAENPGREVSIAGKIAVEKPNSYIKSPPGSRIVVGETAPTSRKRMLSGNSLNLMIAIVGVLLTITVQRFSGTPAVANGSGRIPIFVAVAPQMEGALTRAEAAWEKTSEGARFDLVVQPTGSRAGLSRALGAPSGAPDAWIPTDNSWIELYNRRARSLKRQPLAAEASLAQSPMILMARTERAGELRRLFPNHQITSWNALRGAVAHGAAGHLGLSDPQKTESGALARVSMAREWGARSGIAPAQAAKNADFWRWMSGFEDNSPSASARTADMVKDMAQGTTGRFWWVVAYESDALQGMGAGKALEIFYLPRTTLASHPFCAVERVGAPSDVAAGRANFERFLRSDASQKAFLNDGFRPTEINLKTKTEANPFLRAAFRARGARIDGLPVEERSNSAATEIIAQEWGRRYG